MNSKAGRKIAAIVCLVLLARPQSSRAQEHGPIWNPTASKQQVVEGIRKFRQDPRRSAEALVEVVGDKRFPDWHRRLALFEYFCTSGHNISLAALLRPVSHLKIIKPKHVLTWTDSTSLPEPLQTTRRRRDCEYYALQPKMWKSDNSAVVLEVKGRWEPSMPYDAGEYLSPKSPFLSALRGSSLAQKLVVLRIGIFDDEGLFPICRK